MIFLDQRPWWESTIFMQLNGLENQSPRHLISSLEPKIWRKLRRQILPSKL